MNATNVSLEDQMLLVEVDRGKVRRSSTGVVHYEPRGTGSGQPGFRAEKAMRRLYRAGLVARPAGPGRYTLTDSGVAVVQAVRRAEAERDWLPPPMPADVAARLNSELFGPAASCGTNPEESIK